MAVLTFDRPVWLPVKGGTGVAQDAQLSVVGHRLSTQLPGVLVQVVAIQQVLQHRTGALLAQAVGQQHREARGVALRR